MSIQSGPEGLCPMDLCGDRMKVWIEDDQFEIDAKLRDEKGNIMGEKIIASLKFFQLRS